VLFLFTTTNFGWFYLISVFIFVVLLFALAISKYGKIRLGPQDSKPSFSFFTWVGMLFSAGFVFAVVATVSGYRVYSNDNLETLQQILFFKELGLPLKKIKEIINSPSFNRQEALILHQKMLLEKRHRLDQMISTIDKTIKHMKGEIVMSNKDKFEGFNFSSNPYGQEARERWGDKAIDDANAKIGSM
jgi:DNA-binding transcriptional MerR regulator